MVSFIVISKDKKKREEYSKVFTKEHHIHMFDTTVLEKDTSDKKSTQSIGIEDIKQLQKKIFLKPIKSKSKAIIIQDAQLLTPEAQNALLKVLEEPPAHTMILLNTTSKEALLPTILSRCQIVELEIEPLKLKEKELLELQTFITDLPNLSIGQKLKYAEKHAKDKDKALAWIEKLILVLREQTITVILNDSEESMNDNVLILRSFQSLHTTLKTTNVNPRFAIENTLLNL
ncbi:MAG: hypothetical protein ACR2LN_03180 [Candidatus Levyibacteriota bacterium]